MQITSKQANKILNKYDDELNNLTYQESKGSTFLASVGEDVESCRPQYNYEEHQKAIAEVENKIIKLKHCINKFNCETIVDGTGKTIDEVLVYIAQLTRKKAKLYTMSQTPPKDRENRNMHSNIIDYRYTNYDIDKVKQDYKEVSEELSKVQIALDTVNVTKTFEVEL